MEIIKRQTISPYLSFLRVCFIILGLLFTSLLLFKDLYYYSWDEKKETIIYSIPMVFIFFLWLRYRLDDIYAFQHKLVLIDFLAVGLSLARLFSLLYHSGHVVFLLYSFLTTKNKFYKWISGIMLLFTFCLKFFYWNDYITPILGLIIALILVHYRKKQIQKLHINTII